MDVEKIKVITVHSVCVCACVFVMWNVWVMRYLEGKEMGKDLVDREKSEN